MLKLLRTRVIFLIALCLAAGPLVSRAGDSGPSEPQLKAAFLLNFPKYVQWPSNALAETNSPIVVGIVGNDNVAQEFAAMSQGKVIEGHPIRLLRPATAAQCHGCQILFVGAGETRKLPEIAGQLKGSSILTVGESDEFIDQGGMINLARRERRIVLEVNLDATRQSELKISSKLMALATVKGGKK